MTWYSFEKDQRVQINAHVTTENKRAFPGDTGTVFHVYEDGSAVVYLDGRHSRQVVQLHQASPLPASEDPKKR
jgi:ribosomal protein L21E